MWTALRLERTNKCHFALASASPSTARWGRRVPGGARMACPVPQFTPNSLLQGVQSAQASHSASCELPAATYGVLVCAQGVLELLGQAREALQGVFEGCVVDL